MDQAFVAFARDPAFSSFWIPLPLEDVALLPSRRRYRRALTSTLLLNGSYSIELRKAYGLKYLLKRRRSSNFDLEGYLLNLLCKSNDTFNLWTLIKAQEVLQNYSKLARVLADEPGSLYTLIEDFQRERNDLHFLSKLKDLISGYKSLDHEFLKHNCSYDKRRM